MPPSSTRQKEDANQELCQILAIADLLRHTYGLREAADKVMDEYHSKNKKKLSTVNQDKYGQWRWISDAEVSSVSHTKIPAGAKVTTMYPP